MKELAQSNYSGDQKMYKECLHNFSKDALAYLPSVQRMCERSRVRACKVIRMQMRTAEYLLDIDPYIKIIYYVRDPRGIIESRFRNRKQTSDLVARTAAIAQGAVGICSKMRTDLAAMKLL